MQCNHRVWGDLMNNKIRLAVVCLLLVLNHPSLIRADEHEGVNMTEEEEEGSYDAELADQLGADKYGMRRYVVALLKAGPVRDQAADEAGEIQRAHLENIRKLGGQGKLALAGPFLDNGSLRGIYIFNVETVEEARALTETDPAIQAGRLEMELHPWYGSAALMKVNEIHESIHLENP